MNETCEATIRQAEAGPYGFVSLRCGTRVGLRTFFDATGVAHAFCPAVGHLDELLRRFGVMPGDPIDAYKAERDRRLYPVRVIR